VITVRNTYSIVRALRFYPSAFQTIEPLEILAYFEAAKLGLGNPL